MLIGYEGGMLSAIWLLGYASAVKVTQEYIAPDAPREGRIVGAAFAVVEAAVPVAVDETAAAHVSVTFGMLVGEESWATRRGYRILQETTWETKEEKAPARNDISIRAKERIEITCQVERAKMKVRRSFELAVRCSFALSGV